jgi:hypothetical protein
VKGQKILEPLQVEAMQRICHMVRHHHEMFDGRGYPDKLQGDQILLGARILAVADCFDTMVSDRAYKPARSYEEAFAELRRCSGTQFDPRLVEAFLESLRIYGDPRRRPPSEEDDIPIEIMGARAFSRDAWHGMPLRAGRHLGLKLIASTLGMTTALPVPGNGCAFPSSGSSERRGRRWPGPTYCGQVAERLVAEWLEEKLGIVVPELEHERAESLSFNKQPSKWNTKSSEDSQSRTLF